MTASTPGTAEPLNRIAATWQRVWTGVGANAFGQAVSIGTQLVWPALFLHYWSLAEYGLWLMISAVPGYFSLADVGVGTVAMNKMTMLVARGRHRDANGVFQTALGLTVASTLALLLLALAVIWGFDLGPVRDVPTRLTLSLLIAGALIGTFTSLLDGLFRASGQFAKGTLAIHTARLVEWLGGVAGLLLYRSMLAVAAGMLVARVLATLVMTVWTRWRFPQFRWGRSAANRGELLELLPPAAAFLALPVGNALLLQGVTIAVGSTFGPGVLAVFNTYRTLSRVPVQLLTMFSRSLWPEMSRSYGAGDVATLNRLYRQSARTALVLCAVTCIALYACGPVIVKLWTHGKIAPDACLLGLFLLVALCSCAWQIEQVLLSATNTHLRLSFWYVSAAVLVVLLVAMLPPDLGMRAPVGALMLFELVMFIVSRRLVAAPLRGAAA